MSERKKIIFTVLFATFFLAALTVVGIIGFFLGKWTATSVTDLSRINSFADCQAAGYPILLTYPASCSTPDGRSYTEVLEHPVQLPSPTSVAFPSPAELAKMSDLNKCNDLLQGIWFEADKTCREANYSFTETECTSLGGKYNECDSPCNATNWNPNLSCIQMCQKVCTFT